MSKETKNTLPIKLTPDRIVPIRDIDERLVSTLR